MMKSPLLFLCLAFLLDAGYGPQSSSHIHTQVTCTGLRRGLYTPRFATYCVELLQSRYYFCHTSAHLNQVIFLPRLLISYTNPVNITIPPRLNISDTSAVTISCTQVFSDVFARENQLIRADPRHGTYLACGLLMRGATANISDINRNVARLRPSLRMAHWNSEVCHGAISCVSVVHRCQHLLSFLF